MKVVLRVGMDSCEKEIENLQELDSFLKTDAIAIKKMMIQNNKSQEVKMEEVVDGNRRTVTIDPPVVAAKPQELHGETCPKCGSTAGLTLKVSSGFKNAANKGKAYKVCNDCNQFIEWARVM